MTRRTYSHGINFRNKTRGAAFAAATGRSFVRESVASLRAVSVQGYVASAVRARVLWGGDIDALKEAHNAAVNNFIRFVTYPHLSVRRCRSG